jgi:hypothetical protein
MRTISGMSRGMAAPLPCTADRPRSQAHIGPLVWQISAFSEATTRQTDLIELARQRGGHSRDLIGEIEMSSRELSQ